MIHPKHTPAPKGKGPKRTSPQRRLLIGLRSARQIRDALKDTVIVPVTEQPWITNLARGDNVLMPIRVKNAGFISADVTASCFHATLAEIPACERGHTAERIDAEGDWYSVLTKAAWGSPAPTTTEIMDQRASQGWVVINFEPVRLPREWEAQAKQCREAVTA